MARRRLRTCPLPSPDAGSARDRHEPWSAASSAPAPGGGRARPGGGAASSQPVPANGALGF